MSSRKYVIAKPFYGFGGNLSVLACAWLAARKLDRRLIVDWRGMYYGGGTDYFHKLFKPLSRQVPISEIAEVDGGVFPTYWTKFVHDTPRHHSGYNLTAATSDLLFDPGSGFVPEKHPIAVVSRDGSFFHWPEFRSELKQFFAELVPVDEIETIISDFAICNFEHFTIGVHFRHGNGEATVVPPDFEWFCNSIDELGAGAPQGRSKIFIATDCRAALDRFRARYGDRVMSYPKPYPAHGAGGMQYREPQDKKLVCAIEALTDIRLLSRCQAFVGSKSFFSACANLWGTGLDRTNSRWFIPRLRAFKPSSEQRPVVTDPELLSVFGGSYPCDNIYIDPQSGKLFFQDLVVGDRASALKSVDQMEKVKQNILRYRLY